MNKKIILKTNILHEKIRLDLVLYKLINSYSRTKIKKLIINRKVKVNNKIIVYPDYKVLNNQIIKVKIKKSSKKIYKPINLKLNILYEDDHILIINKENDIVVHPGAGNENNTILNRLLYYIPKISLVSRCGIIHRLDKNTTGLMIIAKNEISRCILLNNFKNKKIIREYKGIVFGSMISGGMINKSIKRHSKNRKRMMIDINGKKSITHYRIIKRLKYHTIVKFILETGRTHQIRVHMEYINHPIVGDKVYGKMYNNTFYNINNFISRQALHSSLLKLNHPIYNNKIKFKSTLPKDIKLLINKLKKLI